MPLITVIDNTSCVRHACFDSLTALGQFVAVFHSPETFVDSGAIFATDLLILGRTRSCRTKCEALRWASAVRPDLGTFLLHPDCTEWRPLRELCEEGSLPILDDNPSRCLEILRKALDSGVLLRRNGPTLKQPQVRLDVHAT
jgi:hypothetical protein